MTLSRNAHAAIRAVGCALLLLVTYGIGIITLSLYVKPLSIYFGVSTAAISPMLTLWGISSFIMAALAGRIIAKIKIQGTVLLGAFGFLTAFLLISFATKIWMCYLAGLFMGVGGIFAGYTMTQVNIMTWFKTGRATIFGLVGLGEGFGGSTFAFIVSSMINSGPLGYKNAAMMEAIVIFAVAAFVGMVMMRGTPEDYGFAPVGSETETINERVTRDDLPGLTEKEAYKLPTFWALLFAILVFLIGQYIILPQQSAMLSDFGYSAIQVATSLSVFSMAKVLNKLLFGVIADKFGLWIAVAYSSIAMLIGIVVVVTVHSTAGVIIFVLFLGMGASIGGNYGALVMARLCGRKNIDIFGPYTNSACGIGVAVGPLIFSAIYTLSSHSYKSAMTAAFIFLAIALVINLGYVIKQKNFFDKELIGEFKLANNENAA